MKSIIKDIEEMRNLAENFVAELKPNSVGAKVVGLYGELGAGKTTFSQAVAKSFDVSETVTSPTFVIMKVYDISYTLKFERLIHIDAYRLEKSEELLHLGWQEIISDPKNLILIEWPERVQDIIPEHIRINFEHISENSREIEILEQ